MKNKDLRIVPRTSDHDDECAVCGRKRLGRKAVAAVFHPDEPPIYASIYCFTCIDGMLAARRRVPR